MTSFQKINEANFFLGLLNDYFQDNDKCDYCISAFLHASYDLIDHTLEEYQIHFGLYIRPLDLTIASFIDAANKNNNVDAIGFIKLYIAELTKIYTNPVSVSLLIIRNTNTHSYQMLTPFNFSTNDVVDTRYFMSLMIPPAVDRFKEDLIGFMQAKLKRLARMNSLLNAENKTFSHDDLKTISSKAVEILAETDVRKVCEMQFNLLDSFVCAIRAKYPRW